MTVKVTINSLEVPNSLTVKMKGVNNKGLQINPDNLSPVLKSEIIFYLESSFPFELKEEDFSVNATLKELSP